MCQGGACVDDPCKPISCGDGFRCALRDDGPLCVLIAPEYRPELVTAAGGGCSTGGAGGGGAIALVVLALGLARRRRS